MKDPSLGLGEGAAFVHAISLVGDLVALLAKCSPRVVTSANSEHTE